MKLTKNTDAQTFILKAYSDGMRTNDILETLSRDFDVTITPRTLFRFIVKNDVSRWHTSHKDWYARKNNMNDNDES